MLQVAFNSTFQNLRTMGNLSVRTFKITLHHRLNFNCLKRFLTDHNVLVYAYELFTQNALDFKG